MVGQNKGENCAMNKILIIDDDRELCALIKRRDRKSTRLNSSH